MVSVNNDQVKVIFSILRKTIQRNTYWRHALGYRPAILIARLECGRLGILAKDEQISTVVIVGHSITCTGVAQ